MIGIRGVLLKILPILLVVSIFLNPAGIPSAYADEISKLVLSKNSLTMEVGDTQSLTATAIYESGATSDVTIKADWSTPDDTVSVYAGTVTAKKEGTATITATYMTKTVVVTVAISKKVRTLTKDAQKVTLRTGDQQQVKLTATYTDGTTEDVTAKAEWTTDSQDVADVLNGLITGVGSGTASVKATLGTQSVTIPVEVDLVKRLDPDQTSIFLRNKGTEQIRLMATFEDGTVEDVAAKAEWSTNKDDVADVVKGLITAYGTGEATITATYGGKTATITVQVDIAKRLEVDKPSLIMQINQSEDVALTAYYADGTSEIVTNKAKWSSSNPDVVDVDSTGKVSSYAVGQATLTASYGTKEVTISVDVGTGKKLEIDKQDLFLHKGESEQLTLTATFADGSTDDVTSEATWTSSDEDVAYVAKGKVSAFGSGEATITATYGDKSVKVSVDVDIPRNLEVNKQDISLQVGDSEQLVLTAAYADGSTDDVTSEADWSSSNEDVAYVKNGKISAYEAGSTVITATYQGKKVTIVVDVDVPRKLEVSDSSLILQDDGSAAVTVYAVYADNRKEDVTKEAEWKSSNEDVAEVSDGVVDGTGIGTATITVTYLNRSATISVQVGVIKDLSASDTRVALDETGSKQVTLTATFGDGTTKDVTEEAEWVSAAEDVASVLDGLIKAKASGKTNVTATYKNKSITIPVEVGVAKTLTADVTKLVMGLTDQKQIKLTATFTQGSVKDVTEEAEWFSGNTKVVSVTSGAVTANGTGKTTITAKYGGATLVIPVEIEVVQKLELNKRYLMMKTGQTEQLVATAVYSNGTTRDVSSEADWTTRNYKIADVVDGLVTATGSGKTTLSVKYGGKTLTIPIENDNLKYLKASAVKLEMKTGEKKQVTLTATYMDNSEANVTVPAIWATSKILVADAKDGIIQANGPGQAMITATYAGKRVTIVVIVRP